MTPSLGTVNSGAINGVRELGNDEYEECTKFISCLMQFPRKQQLFTLLKMNYDDLENLLKIYGLEFSKNKTMDWLRMDNMITNLNRHILNFLSSMRTFLDHTETNLKRLHGGDSLQVKNFSEACSKAYDDHFSYRFLYKLRNYAQHCGMPVGRMSLHSELVPSTGETKDSVTIYFARDELLKNFDWGPLDTEIRSMPDEFEVTQHIKQTMACLDNINSVIIKDDLPDLETSANRLWKLVDEMSSMEGIPCILNIKKMDNEGKKIEANIKWLPLHLIEAFRSK